MAPRVAVRAARRRLPPPDHRGGDRSHDGTVLIGGKAQFLVGAGWPTPAVIPSALTLGSTSLQGNGPGATQLSISRAVGTKGWILPQYAVPGTCRRTTGTRSATRSRTSPTGTGCCPRPPTRPRHAPAQHRCARVKTGVADRADDHLALHEGATEVRRHRDAEYLGYIRERGRRADRIYPFAHGCVDAGSRLSMVYDAMVELKALRPRKGGRRMDRDRADRGLLRPRPGHAQEARAEAWASVAGGAQAVFWFTHTFSKGYWDDFDVSAEMGAGDGVDRTPSSRSYSTVVLARRNARRVSAPDDPVKVGLRRRRRPLLPGRGQPLRRLRRPEPGRRRRRVVAAASGAHLAGRRRAAPPAGAARPGQARFADTIPPFAVRIYSWLPQQLDRRPRALGRDASASGSSNEKLEPAPSSDETQIRPSIRSTSSRQM